MPGPISMKELLECGVHFGHQTQKWNPKMKPYIFGSRNGVHIIDLQQTVRLFRDAYQFILDRVSQGETVLFVGTKRQAADVIEEEADRAGMYYIKNRWLGGTLTNFRTIKISIENLNELERMAEDGNYPVRTKKEAMMKEKLRQKLLKNLSGIRKMSKLPGVLFVIDPRKERIAIHEANNLHIPVVAVCDTNCAPDGVDMIIPGNDDAIRAIKLFAGKVADACLEGQQLYKELGASRVKEESKAIESKRDIGGKKVSVKKIQRKKEEEEVKAEAPVEAKVEEKPVEAKVEEKPVVAKVEEKPVEAKVEEAKPVDETPAGE